RAAEAWAEAGCQAPVKSSRPRVCGTGDPRGTGARHEPAPSLVDVAESSLLNKLIHTSLMESSHHVEILQQDPNSPLFSVKSFEELRLKKELLQGVYAMGFNRPSTIQETALPMMLPLPCRPQNLIAQSRSGTGKTAAFVLAMLSRVNGAEKYPQCLCLAPTYELALQIGHVIEKMGQFCADIRVTYAVQGNRGALLEEQIVIRTPGTMLDWCFKRRVVNMKRISLFVLDEADVMIDHQALQPLISQPVALLGVIAPQVQDPALGLVELHAVDLSPSVQPIQILLQNIKGNQPQHRALGNATNDWAPTGLDSIYHDSLGPAIQPVSNPMKRAPVQVKSSQFLEENAVGDGVKSLAEVKVDHIHSLSLHPACHFVIEGDQVCQAGSAFHKPMLTGPDRLLPLQVLHDDSQEDLLHELPWY
uniref:RNA helicase n=1 Tax=Anas platyrhynchos TaxID=8839 RepID=A0A8B9SXU8_ANAPL